MEGIQKPRGYYRTDPLKATATRYDSDPGLIQELRQQNKPPFYLQTFDLSIAPGAVGSPFQSGGANGGGYEFQNGLFRLPGYGRGFVAFGFTTATLLTTRTVAPTTLIQIGVQLPTAVWQAKHNRGFRGEFADLWLGWAAQAGNSVDLYVFKYDDTPFMSGEAAT